MRFVVLFVICFLLPAIALSQKDPPFELPAQGEVRKLRSAIIYTTKGQLRFELFPDLAPWHVANFKYHADKNLYRNLKIHHFEPAFLLASGDPQGTGRGGPGYTLPNEFSRLANKFGMLGMMRPKDDINPERRSHGSQFYIALGTIKNMDGLYTVFGELQSGREVLEQLTAADIINDIKVFVRD